MRGENPGYLLVVDFLIEAKIEKNIGLQEWKKTKGDNFV